MIGRALDPVTNDLFLLGSQIKTVVDLAQVVQSIDTRLQFFLEEWFLNVDAGTAYFQEIFKKPVNLNNVDSIIKRRILRTPGVTELLSFDLAFTSSTRGVIIAFEANTIFGSTGEQEVTINV